MAIFIALWWLCSYLAIDGNNVIYSEWHLLLQLYKGGVRKGGGVWGRLGLDKYFS